jgi:phosphatidylserine decarboxylase
MSIAKESIPFSVALVLLAIATALLFHPLASVLPLAGLVSTLWFFRDPRRHAPSDPDVLISPADGRLIRAGPRGLSIFMNVFDVHVCRAPMAGRVESVEHTPGRFRAAFRDDASEHNERTSIVLADGQRRVRFTLVAGLIARRIVCRVAPGQEVRAGERIGLIRFGSRVDVELPAGGRLAAAVGGRVRAGETVIARLEPVAVRVAASAPPVRAGSSGGFSL